MPSLDSSNHGVSQLNLPRPNTSHSTCSMLCGCTGDTMDGHQNHSIRQSRPIGGDTHTQLQSKCFCDSFMGSEHQPPGLGPVPSFSIARCASSMSSGCMVFGVWHLRRCAVDLPKRADFCAGWENAAIGNSW